MNVIKSLSLPTLIFGLAGLLPGVGFGQASNNLLSSQGSVTVSPANNSSLPKTLSPQDLLKLEAPPQSAIPVQPVISNLTDGQNRKSLDGRVMDLISLGMRASTLFAGCRRNHG